MKKYLLSLALILGIASFARADLFDRQKDKTVVVRSTITVAANTSTTTILVDLSSDTTMSGWPHTGTRELNVSAISITWDKVAASSCAVKIGVINFINTSTGSVTWFADKNNLRNVSNTGVALWMSPIEGFYKLRANPGTISATGESTDGTTPFLLSNDRTFGSATFQTDVTLPSPLGNRAPGFGDIVLSLTNSDTTNAVDVVVTIFYWAEPK